MLGFFRNALRSRLARPIFIALLVTAVAQVALVASITHWSVGSLDQAITDELSQTQRVVSNRLDENRASIDTVVADMATNVQTELGQTLTDALQSE